MKNKIIKSVNGHSTDSFIISKINSSKCSTPHNILRFFCYYFNEQTKSLWIVFGFLKEFHHCCLSRISIHSIMLILYFYKYMLLFIYNVKTYLWHFPSVSGIFENILMEITYMVLVMFIHLADTFCFYYFM